MARPNEDRAARLAVYFESVAAVRWSWPHSNCLTFLGDWVEAQRPPYDFSRWRGACADERAFLRLVREAGGTDALVAREARRAGLAEAAVAAARTGDVGMIRLPRCVDGSERGGMARFGCIRSPTGKWAMRTLDGLFFLDAAMGVAPYRSWAV